ncbi:MAG: TcaA NTF2-like domain-containing protein [Bacillota bacterium]
MKWKTRFKEGIHNWIDLSSVDDRYKDIKKELSAIAEDIDDELMVMIAGEFNSGKSTFINALLGEKVLSSNITPETAMITKLKYGKERRVIAHFADGTKKEYDPSWLEELTAERDGRAKFIRRNLSYVEYQLSSPILKHFTLIDTPGLESLHEEHTQATERFMKRADVAIWMFNALNVGTSNDVEWLKKLQGYDIKPVCIVNKIDQLDEEEETLDEFLDFNIRRLRPLVDHLEGVAAKEALDGKLNADKESLEFSNWHKIEELFEGFKQLSQQKAERVFSRLKEPLENLDTILLEEKSSFRFHTEIPRLKKFYSSTYPFLLNQRQPVLAAYDETQEEVRKWEEFLNLLKETEEAPSFFEMMLKGIKNPRKKDRLQFQWRNKVLPKLDEYMELLRLSQEKNKVLHSERKRLVQEWEKLEYAKFPTMRKVKAYTELQERFNKKAADLKKENREASSKRTGALIAFRRLETAFAAVAADEISELELQVNEGAAKCNNQLREAKQEVAEWSADYLQRIYDFFKWLNEFNTKVYPSFKDLKSDFHHLPSCKAMQNGLENVHSLFDSFPFGDLRMKWEDLQSWEELPAVSYHLSFDKLGEQLIPRVDIPALDLMDKDTERLVRFISERSRKWGMIAGGAAVAVISAIFFLNGGEEGVPLDEPSVMEAAATSDDREEPIILEDDFAEEQVEQNTIEEIFSFSEIESFLGALQESLQDPYSSPDYIMDSYFAYGSWGYFEPYYAEFAEMEFTGGYIDKVEYTEDERAYVYVEEQFSGSGVEKVYDVTYTFGSDDGSEENILIQDVTYSLASETEVDFLVQDGTAELFFEQYRTAFMEALNYEEFSLVSQYFAADTEEFREMADYFEELSGKGYSFQFDKNEVLSVQHSGVNEYKVSTHETFLFTDDEGVETYYDRSKDYMLQAVGEDELLIKDVIITDSSSEVVSAPEEQEESTVSLATPDNVTRMLETFYSRFEKAFNQNGFPYVEDYYVEGSVQYEADKAYLANAFNKNMQMVNRQFGVEEVSPYDDSHYIASVYIEDEYRYQDGTAEYKKIRAQYLINVSETGGLYIEEMPSLTILEETEL